MACEELKYFQDAFLESYLQTALWAAPEDDQGRTLDRRFANRRNVFTKAAVAQARRVCDSFVRNNWELLQQAMDETGVQAAGLAHDFYLTQNRHGAGFWDGDYPEELGRALTAASHRYPEMTAWAFGRWVEWL
jgi:hypothetical protein